MEIIATAGSDDIRRRQPFRKLQTVVIAGCRIVAINGIVVVTRGDDLNVVAITGV